MTTLPCSSLLRSVETQLKSLPRDASSAAAAQNLAYMESLAAAEAPRRLIEEVLADTNLLSQIASRSYKHANNFDKILLLDSHKPDAYRLSIHHWRSGYDDPAPGDEPVHNHRFSFWAHILRGTMSASIYTEAEDAAEGYGVFPKYKYLPTDSGNVHAVWFQISWVSVHVVCYRR